MSEPKNIIKNLILLPVNARAHVKRDRSERPLRSTNKPRIVVDLLLDDVPLCLTDVSLKFMYKSDFYLKSVIISYFLLDTIRSNS